MKIKQMIERHFLRAENGDEFEMVPEFLEAFTIPPGHRLELVESLEIVSQELIHIYEIGPMPPQDNTSIYA